jgi:hypothetical protein
VESLESLVYVSSAVHPTTDEQLLHLLERARSRNARCRVTGLLLFDAGNFMQYIEGPNDGLIEVYDHIQRDPLHTGLIELCRGPVNQRAFGDWTMAARVFSPTGQVRNVLCDTDQSFDFVPLAAAPGSAGVLLRGFWDRGRRPPFLRGGVPPDAGDDR